MEASVIAVPEIRAEPAVVLAAAKSVVLDQETTPPPICQILAVHSHAVPAAATADVPSEESVEAQSVPAAVPVF